MANDKIKIEKLQVYNLLTSLVNHSEQIRWMRFNTLLVVNSILILAWVAVFAIKPYFSYKPMLLTALCIPGIISSILWIFLGKRSSKYLDIYYEEAEKIMEEKFPEISKPLHLINNERNKLKEFPANLTSSRWIVTCFPIFFLALYLYLIFISWLNSS